MTDRIDASSAKQSENQVEPLSHQVLGWFKEKAHDLAETTPGKAIAQNNAEAAREFAALPAVQFIEEKCANVKAAVVNSDLVRSECESMDRLSHSWLGRKTAGLVDNAGAAADFMVVQPLAMLDSALGKIPGDLANCHPIDAIAASNQRVVDSVKHTASVQYDHLANSDFVQTNVAAAEKLSHTWVGRKATALVDNVADSADFLFIQPMKELKQTLSA